MYVAGSTLGLQHIKVSERNRFLSESITRNAKAAATSWLPLQWNQAPCVLGILKIWNYFEGHEKVAIVLLTIGIPKCVNLIDEKIFSYKSCPPT